MKAFLSSGLKNDEMYWVSLLADQLNKKKIDVITPNFLDETSYHGNLTSIYSCNIYIGLLTNPFDIQRILFEFNNSIKKIPSLLVIESSLYESILNRHEFKINPKMQEYIIPLNHNNIESSIDLIRNKIDKIKSDIADKNLAWLIGGLALLGLFYLLNEDK
jgi:hypothetical protein